MTLVNFECRLLAYIVVEYTLQQKDMVGSTRRLRREIDVVAIKLKL